MSACCLIALLLTGCKENAPPNSAKVQPASQRLPKANAPN
jgi:hypothetical protein